MKGHGHGFADDKNLQKETIQQIWQSCGPSFSKKGSKYHICGKTIISNGEHGTEYHRKLWLRISLCIWGKIGGNASNPVNDEILIISKQTLH